MWEKLRDLERRYAEIGELLEIPDIYGDPAQLKKLTREQKELEAVVAAYRAYQKAEATIAESEALLSDPELADMAREELKEAKAEPCGAYKYNFSYRSGGLASRMNEAKRLILKEARAGKTEFTVQPDGRAVQFGHVVLEPGALETHAGPVDVGIAVRSHQDGRIDAEDTLDAVFLGREGTVRMVDGGHADGEAAAGLGRIREVEIVFPVPVHAFRRPHGIAFRITPGNVLLVQDYAVVRPVDKVLRGKNVIVFHAEPPPFGFHRTDDVVGSIQPYLPFEHTGGRVGGELVPDDRILGQQAG